ncbi:MAG: hypothetical protein MUD08_07820 [Cytophagales bacterium]|jgi:hypothetical protein|nr:hypothetical protein [Cytophagales bacterium]
MHSTQINFYILPSDMNAISSWIEEKGISVVGEQMENASNLHFATKNFLEPERKFNTAYLCNGKFPGSLFARYNSMAGKCFFDVDLSLLIEFSMPAFIDSDQKNLKRSRFYCVTSYYEGEARVRKNADFLRWVGKFYREFKKKFLVKYESAQADWASPSAIEWERNGGTLALWW